MRKGPELSGPFLKLPQVSRSDKTSAQMDVIDFEWVIGVKGLTAQNGPYLHGSFGEKP